jgi:hypothetical protein
MESHVVAYKYAIADSQLQGEALVICCPNTDSGPTFFSDLKIRIDDTKELRFLYGEVFFDDGDTTSLELTVESLHQVVVGDRRPCVRSRGSFEGLEALTIDVLSARVSDQTSRHIILLVLGGNHPDRANGTEH